MKMSIINSGKSMTSDGYADGGFDVKAMIRGALEARSNAYVPYSRFAVGAALLSDDGVVTLGCNIENSSYGACNCAERTAIFKAVSEGRRKFTAIAIVGGKAEEKITQYAYPCGICRQVMSEFCDGDTFSVIVAKSIDDYKIYKLKELLPANFGAENMK